MIFNTISYFGGLKCLTILGKKITLEVTSSRKSKDCVQPSSKCVQLVELKKELYSLILIFDKFTFTLSG